MAVATETKRPVETCPNCGKQGIRPTVTLIGPPEHRYRVIERRCRFCQENSTERRF